MYWEHYGFNEPPFALTPNPAFLFLSSPHQEAFAHLLFAIENRAGFIELSGEVGTGKTTIVRTLLNQLDPEIYRTALIFNPTLTPIGLLKEVCTELGVSGAGDEMHELHQALNRFLLEENGAGRTVVLVIDEAQNLSVQVLEQIRLISNLETERSKLIQIVLVGQPELRALLARQDLRQLDQRITVRYHLKAMGSADTGEYIRHRIRFAAGGREPLHFSAGAVQRIYRFSGGLPRLINGVCDRALLLSYTRETYEVTPAMAALAIADLRKDVHRPVVSRRVAAWGGGGIALCAVALALVLFPASREPIAQHPEKVGGQAAAAKKVATAAVAAPVAPASPVAKGAPAPVVTAKDSPLSRDAALAGLGSLSEDENLVSALNAVLAEWRAPAMSPSEAKGGNLKALARRRGLTATRVTGGIDAVARLDAPALLHVPLPHGGSRLLALTELGKETVTVVPAIGGRSVLTRDELAAIWSGGATFLWKDFHGITTNGKGVEKTEKVTLLQGLLQGAGCYEGTPDGTMGPKTVEAIALFQRREGLAVDGKVAGQTLILLYRRAGGFFPPGVARKEGKPSSAPARTDAGGAAQRAHRGEQIA
ncbi:AAA family ATPase [Geomonas sp. RF6]|uniref:AAA family ATPase n=1 Tax=Geomonas sp. RF6 TaxID=2897342 RepID=UPI001E62E6EB|nr:AAA family ATPase [Geomonas sp. RF6]UFS69572.1 AAA family ATPase [Geomonas sp. RF6]